MQSGPPKLLEVKPLQGFRLWLRYNDGEQGDVDLSVLAGRGAFSLWDEPATFEAARLAPHGAVVWGDEVDLCGDALYLRLTGKTPEEVFPALSKAAVDA
jgi:hypothetical protein